ncbi:hypothetical protein D3C73_1196710 [compost metagenome]
MQWRDVLLGPTLHLVLRHRTCDEISLANVAPQLQQQLAMLDAFHPFGNHLSAKRPRQAYNRLGQGQIVVIMQDVANERAVDLDRLRAQALEVTERRIPGAEVP